MHRDTNGGIAKEGIESLWIPFEAVRQVGRGSALVLAPHPDDEVFGCAGAIMRHVANNDDVCVIILTDGRFGNLEMPLHQDAQEGKDPQDKPYVEMRKQESLSAAKKLGYGTPQFWHIPDRELEYGEALVCRTKDQIEKIRASFVYAPSLFEIHPDHRALAMIAVEAVRRCEDSVKLVMYEIARPLNPNLFLDISDLLPQKQEAMKCFVSQIKIRPYDQYMTALNRYRAYTLPETVTAAEAFYVAGAAELSANPLQIYSSEFERQKLLGLCLDIKDNPLVTVIVRTIGRKFLIRKALDSVALQTYPNIEVVIVNAEGGEGPQMDQWCGRFPLRVCGTSQPLPRAVAANLGLDNAHGKYLIFLDDDDWFEPDHIASLVKNLQENPNVQAVYSGVRCIDEKGQDKGIFFNYPYDPVRLLAANQIPINALLFDKDLLQKGCRFDETFDIYEDWDFWIQLSLHTNFFHLDQITAVYRISNLQGSGVHTHEKIREGREKIFEKWRHRWTSSQLYNLMEYALKQQEVSELKKMTDEQAARLADHERQLAHIFNSKAYRIYRLLRMPVRFILSSFRR